MIAARPARRHRVRDALAAGRVPVGAFVQMASPEIVEIAGAAGYDYVWIDGEHGHFGIETMVTMIRAAEASGTTPIVRVPSQDAAFIKQVLDAGAMGIVVPQVESAEQAAAIVRAARYPRPGGQGGLRGACPLVRATDHQTLDWPSYAAWANETISVWTLVETVAGLDQLDAILDVPGIDAIVLGAFDLAATMGHDGDRRHPAVEARLDGMIGTIVARGVDVVGLLFDADVDGMRGAREHYLRQGCRILVAGSDRRILVNQYAAIRSAMEAPALKVVRTETS